MFHFLRRTNSSTSLVSNQSQESDQTSNNTVNESSYVFAINYNELFTHNLYTLKIIIILLNNILRNMIRMFQKQYHELRHPRKLKTILLTNVLYVPDIHKNYVSKTLLSMHGFMMVFESQKLVLLKGGTFA